MGVDSQYVRGSVEKGLFGSSETVARIGRFEITSRLGQGGMGVVYAAHDPELDRPVALKLLSPDLAEGDTERARLRSEARALAKLSHPNVVGVFEIGDHEGQLFVAMELVEGVSLRTWLESESRNTREVLDVFEAAGAGLEAAHARGLVHRDFKPDNVMVGADGTVKVVDFGLARRDADREQVARLADDDTEAGTVTTRGTILGTPAYMAPEQLAGEPADARSDQFAFCAALYEAIQGRRPFEGDSFAELKSNVERGPAADRSRWVGPRWLRAIIRRGLDPDPTRRWADMPTLLRALRSGRRRKWWWLAGTSATGLAIVSAFAVTASSPAPDASAAANAVPPTEACPPAKELLEDVWTDGAKAHLRKRFSDDPYPYSRPTYDVIESELDELSRDWADTWDRTCRQDAPERRRLRAQNCLLQRKQELSFIGGALALIPVSAAALRAHLTITDLPDPRDCLEPAVIDATPSPPEESERDEVDALHNALLFSYARQATTREDLAKIYEPLIARAEALRYPILAEVLTTYATRLADIRHVEFKKVADRAIEVAERTRNDRALATMAIRYAKTKVSEGDFEHSAEDFQRASVALDRAGRPLELEVRFLLARSYLAIAQRRFEEAWKDVERARARIRERYGDRDARLIAIEASALDVAAAAVDLPAFSRGLQTLETIAPEMVAGHHPGVAYIHRAWARVAYLAGDRDNAAQHWARMREELEAQTDAEGNPDPDTRSITDMLLLADYVGIYQCERGRQLLKESLARASPRWQLELHALGVTIEGMVCFDEAKALAHAEAGLPLFDQGEATSVRAGQILGAFEYWYTLHGSPDEAKKYRARADAYAESTLNGKTPVVGWRTFANYQIGALDEAWALREILPDGDWAGPFGRGAAASFRVIMAEIAFDLEKFEESRALLDDALPRIRRCCADTLVGARAEFAHARHLWRDPKRREEALKIARATQAMYQKHGVTQGRLTGLVDAWLAERARE